MRKQLQGIKHARVLRGGLSLLFGIAVFLFWGVRHLSALSFHEQFQLFLFDGDYFAGRVAQPGGVARYVAEFLVQLYNSTIVGALILSVLYMLIQRLTWRLTCRMDAHRSLLSYPLSFVPVCLLWYYMGDLSVMLTFAVSLAIAMSLALAWPKGRAAKWIFLFIGMPVIYWVVGPAAWVAALFILFYEWARGASRAAALLYGVVALLLVLACVLMSAVLVPYPLPLLFRGIDYYRIMLFAPLMQFIVMAAVVIVPFLCRFLPQKAGGPSFAAVVTLVVCWAFFFIPSGFDAKTYELLDYDYLVRTKQWDAIIAKAERQHPDLPMSVCATNLALAMEGQLCDRLFEFYQNGVQGLLPDFERNYATSLLTSEAYFQLGMVNTAQRFAFETMEALPNFNKSCRVMKRLAETNIINGQYEAARKYLKILEKTAFYRPWARRNMELLGNEELISQHPLYGAMRRKRLQEDFLFNNREADKMMGQLFLKDSTNQVAMQYLLAIPMLNGDGERLTRFMYMVNEQVPCRPVACQEAMVTAFAQHREQPPVGLIDPIVLQRYNEFMQSYHSSGVPDHLKNTYWYYITNQGQK